ncbi:hypothetical protein M378DRAFT_13199 [Amanita muscaria Koide BX008]|uniref:Uncharacterized protein n=1 Tax=Amanita muscaria (strain Koide BX008) TaxID=946122 RepID=A0A0C2WYD2_AMAMK|nr:hypothetical protein M378DRAFT_13199 [Amanita muscaria Koide BX008]
MVDRVSFLRASLKLSESFVDSETRSKSYAIEINRRLALYLERSGGYPLTLDIFLLLDHNKAFAMMTLEMLSACAHRRRTVRFDLFFEWQVDCILPRKGKLPTLERLEIMILAASKHALDVFERASHSLHRELDSEDGLPQVAPIPLNQLHILEVPHPAILWFETPSLCDLSLYLVNYLLDNDEPLDVHGQISSLIQRSGCHIPKLSSRSNKKVHVGMLKDVEEPEIHYLQSNDSSIDISSLPKLRLLTFIDAIHKDIEPLANICTGTVGSPNGAVTAVESGACNGILCSIVIRTSKTLTNPQKLIFPVSILLGTYLRILLHSCVIVHWAQ